jgi:hypothetical protein
VKEKRKRKKTLKTDKAKSMPMGRGGVVKAKRVLRSKYLSIGREGNKYKNLYRERTEEWRKIKFSDISV